MEAEGSRSYKQASELWRALASLGEESPAELKRECGMTLQDVRLRIGGALYQDDDLEGAVSVWETLLEEAPSQEVRRSLTFAYMGLNRLEQGRRTGEEFLNQDREDPEVWKIMGRIYACLAEETGRKDGDPLEYWQKAIDALNEVLIAFNPLDQVAIEWKARCVDGIEGHFMPDVERKLGEFLRLVRRESYGEAHKVMYSILPRVVEHVADLQAKDPEKSLRTAENFLTLLQREARRADIDLDEVFGYVIAQLKILIMWSCHAVSDRQKADDALREAIRYAPERTMPYVAEAQLKFARGRKDDVVAPLEKAQALVRTEHDKYLVAQAHHALGQFHDALDWAESVDVEELRGQVYRPERSVAAFKRFLAEVGELSECSDDLQWEELSPESIQLIIRQLLGDTSVDDES